MRSSRFLFVVSVVLGAAVVAVAQSGGQRPRTVAGVCGATNWVCVAECIDAECVDKCLREDCEKALDRLKVCSQKAGCAPDDSECVERACGKTCQRSFEPAPPSPEKERKDPCEAQAASGSPPPEDLVGEWTLSAASLPEETDGGPERIEAQPRSDYARSLRITSTGCFVLRTRLEQATLGQGNELTVRAWGQVEASGKDRLTLRPQDGQAVGPVCGDTRVIPLSKRKVKWRGGTFKWDLDKDTLTLMRDDASKQTFQFDREPAEEKK
jgi:hypothetical protein